VVNPGAGGWDLGGCQRSPSQPEVEAEVAAVGVAVFIANGKLMDHPMATEVRYLRAFRDQYLLTSKIGGGHS